MTLWLISMVLFVASSLLGGLNYIVTVVNLRTKGMKMLRLPLTIWAFLVTAILGVLSFPVLVSAVVLLLMDRSMGTAFYLSDIFIGGEALDVTGGSPILSDLLHTIDYQIRKNGEHYFHTMRHQYNNYHVRPYGIVVEHHRGQ